MLNSSILQQLYPKQNGATSPYYAARQEPAKSKATPADRSISTLNNNGHEETHYGALVNGVPDGKRAAYNFHGQVSNYLSNLKPQAVGLKGQPQRVEAGSPAHELYRDRTGFAESIAYKKHAYAKQQQNNSKERAALEVSREMSSLLDDSRFKSPRVCGAHRLPTREDGYSYLALSDERERYAKRTGGYAKSKEVHTTKGSSAAASKCLKGAGSPLSLDKKRERHTNSRYLTEVEAYYNEERERMRRDKMRREKEHSMRVGGEKTRSSREAATRASVDRIY